MRTLSRHLPISLVIPAYNSEPYIRAALRSVVGQSHVPAEIIVVDDGSTDRTGDVAAEFGARVVRLPGNFGPSAARNAGVIAAREPWIAFLDADDVWRDGKLATQWKAIQRWPDAGFCFTDYDVVAADGVPYSHEMIYDAGYALGEASACYGQAVRFDCGALSKPLAHSMFIRQSSALVRRSLFINSGGYDETLRLSEDYDFFLRLSGRAPAISIERPLVVYHRRDSSLSVDPIAEVASIDRMWVTILKHPERYPAGIVRLIERRRPETLQKGCRIALRLGRFDDAIAFAQQARAARCSAAALMLLISANALNNVAGRSCFRALRAVWRSRPPGLEWSGRLRRLASHTAVEHPYVVGRH
jgi:glycosyltransferase involved in cell wall biosynthesis